MAIVEDDTRNCSEEENEIEIVIEGEEVEQDSEDSDDEDEEEDEASQKKAAELEKKISEDPYDYDDHIELIQALWSLSELDRWRTAYQRLQQMSLLRAEDWLLRIQTEETLAHTPLLTEHISHLFQQASLDCYSIPLLNEWCTWAMTAGMGVSAREQVEEVLKRGGCDPVSGKIFWDAKYEIEKAKLDTMREEHPDFIAQRQRVLWCLEEAVSRPLFRGDEAWPLVQDYIIQMHDQDYLENVKKQHDAAVDYLQRIAPFEDKLMAIDDIGEKFKIYQAYIETVKTLGNDMRYAECDSNGILKVLYDRATTECLSCEGAHGLLVDFARHVKYTSTRMTLNRVLDLCTRRCPKKHTFWVMKIQHAEQQEEDYDVVKSILEMALSKGMDSFKEAEKLWLGYLDYLRRKTQFDVQEDIDRMRRTFRLAWDTLAANWGEEANDCEIPVYWARLEYKRVKDPIQGKEIFEELFRYGENSTLSKYWEALIHLETYRVPNEKGTRRIRELHRRALRNVSDYPPAVAKMWVDYELDCGRLDDVVDCQESCQRKVKEWRDSYQAMKEKMLQKNKGKQPWVKKSRTERKETQNDNVNKGKRKAEGPSEARVKRKKDDVVVAVADQPGVSGVKRSHNDDSIEAGCSKKQRIETETSGDSGREACTLFVSNLNFKVNEDNLKNKLSEFGEIVAMRVKSGVKAFGGSICYCEYKTPDSVEEALKHDRTALDGRPMFLSRYSSKKDKKPAFKYAMTTENNKLFVRNLPFTHCTKEILTKIFEKYGVLNDVRIVTFKDGKPKGLAYIEYEDEASASEALSKTNGLVVKDRTIEVAVSAPPPKVVVEVLGDTRRDLGVGIGMRRTQLSSFLPRVLQTPVNEPTTSSSGDTKKLSNNDFRSMLLKK